MLAKIEYSGERRPEYRPSDLFLMLKSGDASDVDAVPVLRASSELGELMMCDLGLEYKPNNLSVLFTAAIVTQFRLSKSGKNLVPPNSLFL